jgi:hypothetical protein
VQSSPAVGAPAACRHHVVGIGSVAVGIVRDHEGHRVIGVVDHGHQVRPTEARGLASDREDELGFVPLVEVAAEEHHRAADLVEGVGVLRRVGEDLLRSPGAARRVDDADRAKARRPSSRMLLVKYFAMWVENALVGSDA